MDQSDLLELLKKGDVSGFNEARNKVDRVDFYAEDLSELKAAEADLSGVNMDKADLTDADLTDAVLARASMTGADLENTAMSGIMGLKLRLKEVYAEGVDLRMAELSGGDLSDAEFTSCKLDSTTLTHAKLKRTSFTSCSFVETEMVETSANNTVFSECDLTGGTFTEASFVEATFTDCRMEGADFGKARLTRAKLKGSDLSAARFQGADLSGADLSGCILSGTDFTRADLTGVNFEGCDLSGAILTEAELAAEHRPAALPVPAPKAWLVEDTAIAVGHEHVLVLWENAAEEDGRPRLRVAVGKLSARKGPTTVNPLPLPAELVLARSVAASSTGFLVAVLLERPGGATLQLIPIGLDGSIGAPRSLRMPYTPSVRPLMVQQNGAVYVYGISREGPGVQVHRVTEDGLERVFAKAYAQARGFASDHMPIVLSKGGVVVALTERGLGNPAGVPRGFPGRTCAAGVLEDRIALAWASKTDKGLYYNEVGGRQTEEPTRLLPKETIGTIDLAVVGGTAWAAFTREPVSFGATGAWLAQFPEGNMVPVVDDEERDVSEVRIHSGANEPVVTTVLSDGRFEVHTVSGTKVRRRWQLG